MNTAIVNATEYRDLPLNLLTESTPTRAVSSRRPV